MLDKFILDVIGLAREVVSLNVIIFVMKQENKKIWQYY